MSNGGGTNPGYEAVKWALNIPGALNVVCAALDQDTSIRHQVVTRPSRSPSLLPEEVEGGLDGDCEFL
jgi:hypothetical protein